MSVIRTKRNIRDFESQYTKYSGFKTYAEWGAERGIFGQRESRVRTFVRWQNHKDEYSHFLRSLSNRETSPVIPNTNVGTGSSNGSFGDVESIFPTQRNAIEPQELNPISAIQTSADSVFKVADIGKVGQANPFEEVLRKRKPK